MHLDHFDTDNATANSTVPQPAQAVEAAPKKKSGGKTANTK
jgi:hypothetical protein